MSCFTQLSGDHTDKIIINCNLMKIFLMYRAKYWFFFKELLKRIKQNYRYQWNISAPSPPPERNMWMGDGAENMTETKFDVFFRRGYRSLARFSFDAYPLEHQWLLNQQKKGKGILPFLLKGYNKSFNNMGNGHIYLRKITCD